MDDKTRSALDGILRKRQAAQETARSAAEKRRSAEEIFLERFTQHCAAVVRPTMVAFGDYLAGHDCAYEIDTRGETTNGSVVTSAAITIYLFPGGRDRQHRRQEYPALSVIAETREQKVRLHRSTMAPGRGGGSGPIGTYALEQVTPQFLEEGLVDLAREALR